MIRKEMKLVITFHTTTEAMNMEQICKSAGADGRIIPVPRSITSGCGLAWCAMSESEKELVSLMNEKSVRYQAIHNCLV